MFKNLIRICLLSLCLGCGISSNALAQNNIQKTLKYTVKPGDTTFSIARKYGTTVQRIVKLNPGFQPEQLRADQTLEVPAYPDLPSHKEEVEIKLQSNQKIKTTVTYKEYKVKRKDTPYSLAKANSITVDELMDANPELKSDASNLKKGIVIRIPVKSHQAVAVSPGLQRIRVAVLLPLVGSAVENVRSVEFYRGLLMGLEPLKRANVSVEVSVYNEPSPTSSVKQIVSEIVSSKPDVIVGPLYPTHFADVTAVSSRQTKVAIPFSSKVMQVYTRPEVFVLNTPVSYETDLAVNLFMNTFKPQTQVILLQSTNGSKKGFTDELRRKSVTACYPVVTVAMHSTAEQIKAALKGKQAGPCVIVPDDASEATLSNLLPKLKTLRSALPGCQFSLIGYENWLPLSEGQYKLPLHEADAYLISSAYFYPYATPTRAFSDEYKRWFKQGFVDSHPRMAPLGYDFSRAFLGGLATYGKDYCTQSPLQGSVADAPKLQSDLRFASVGSGGGYVSRSMWLVHFRKDLSIVKVSAR